MRKRKKFLLFLSCFVVLSSILCFSCGAYLSVVPEADSQQVIVGQANIPISSYTTGLVSSGEAIYYNFEFHTSGASGMDYGFDSSTYTNYVNVDGIGRVISNYQLESTQRDRVNDFIPSTTTIGTKLTSHSSLNYSNFFFQLGSGVNVHAWHEETYRRNTSFIIASVDNLDLYVDVHIDYLYYDENKVLQPGSFVATDLILVPTQQGSSYIYDFTDIITSALTSCPDMCLIVGGLFGVETANDTPFNVGFLTVYNQHVSSLNLKRLYSLAFDNQMSQTFGLFSWLGNAVEGVFNVNLFYIGTFGVSLGLLFLAPVGILTVIMVLKMFAGG